MESITINGMNFQYVDGCNYKYDYIKIYNDIKKQTSNNKRKILRKLIRDDLFFLYYFILKIPIGNHPFIVDRCAEVEDGPKSKTLDIWARGHGKSTIITIGETVQYHLKYPDRCSLLFSYKKGAADKFLFSIMGVFQSDYLISLFPDILYKDPGRDSPCWGMVNGIALKRKSDSRGEKTIQTCGLVKGMLQGGHFERRVYDDIETGDMQYSVEQNDKCFEMFELSANLQTHQEAFDIDRVVGTPYANFGTIERIKNMKDAYGKPMYTARIHTITGTSSESDPPIFVSQKTMDELKLKSSFYAQQMCDPTPRFDTVLNPEMIKFVNSEELPKNLFKFIVIDPAGGKVSVRSNCWGIHVIGVEPKLDEIGASNIFVIDSFVDKINESEVVFLLTNMYIRNQFISAVGYESSNSTTPGWLIHYQNALKTHGIILSEETKTLFMISPQGHEKKNRITSSLRMPLLNGKIHFLDNIPSKYIEKIKNEMITHPFGDDDGIDALARIYNVLEKFGFSWRIKKTKGPKYTPAQRSNGAYSWMAR